MCGVGAGAASCVVPVPTDIDANRELCGAFQNFHRKVPHLTPHARRLLVLLEIPQVQLGVFGIGEGSRLADEENLSDGATGRC